MGIICINAATMRNIYDSTKMSVTGKIQNDNKLNMAIMIKSVIIYAVLFMLAS